MDKIADTWTDQWGMIRVVISGNIPYLRGGNQFLSEKSLAGRVADLREQCDELASVLEAARKLIRDLIDQQVMPDDSWRMVDEQIYQVLEKAGQS